MKYFLLLFLAVIFSCQQKKKNPETKTEKPLLRVSVEHKLPDNKDAKYLNEVNNSWKELRTLNSFIKNFKTISPTEALSNAKELSMIAQSVKDSIRPKFLQTAAFKSRVNVFLNEVLRLEDMSRISSIKAEEVNSQVQKVLETDLYMKLYISVALKKIKLEKEVFETNYKSSLDSVSKINIDSFQNKRIEQEIKKQETKILKKDNK